MGRVQRTKSFAGILIHLEPRKEINQAVAPAGTDGVTASLLLQFPPVVKAVLSRRPQASQRGTGGAKLETLHPDFGGCNILPIHNRVE